MAWRSRLILDSGLQGNPDGLVVAADGTVYSTGPGGVMVISPDGKLLGRIMVSDDPMGKKTANTTLGGPDGFYRHRHWSWRYVRRFP